MPRCAEAQQKLDHVLISTLEEARISRRAFSLILFNPPYDFEYEEAGQDKKTVRKERVFLQRCMEFSRLGAC